MIVGDGARTYGMPMKESGHVVLPVELRRMLGLQKGDRVPIKADGNTVTLVDDARVAKDEQSTSQVASISDHSAAAQKWLSMCGVYSIHPAASPQRGLIGHLGQVRANQCWSGA